MKRKFVISMKNYQSNFIRVGISSAMIYTMLDYWKVPVWITSIIMFLCVMAFIKSVYDMGMQVPVDLFEEPGNDVKESVRTEQKRGKSKFIERLEKMAEERGIKLN